jgi:hypothetical protein
MADQLTSNPRDRLGQRGSIDKTCSPPEQVTGDAGIGKAASAVLEEYGTQR